MASASATETSPLLGSTVPGRDESNVLAPGGEPHAPGSAVAAPIVPEGDEENAGQSANQDAGSYEGLPEVKKRMKYIVSALSIGIFLVAADMTLIASSSGKIGSELNALKNTSWIATSYLLTITSAQPLYGKLTDIFGRKACLLWAYCVFGLGCLWCGMATTMESLVLARAFTGIGGGGMTTCASIVLSDIVLLRERGTWQGIINVIFAIGSGVGGPLGGVLSDTIGWRWAFAGQFPVCVLAFIAVLLSLNLPRNDTSNWRTKLRRVDFPGALTLVSAVTLLLVGLDYGSNDSWLSPVTLVCLSLSVCLTVGFGVIEEYVAAEPFAPSRIILEPSLFAAYLCNFFGSAAWLGIMFYVPLFYQGVFALSATQAGLRLLPAIVANLPASLIVGLIIQRTGKFFWLTLSMYAMLATGSALILISISPWAQGAVNISIGFAMAGFGIGGSTTLSLIALLANAKVADQAVTTACSYLFRSLGSSLGVALPSAVLQNMLRVRLQERLGGDGQGQLVDRIRESLDYIRTLDPATQTIVRQSYQESMVGTFGLAVAFAFLAVLSAGFIREKRLSA